jgi:hypothetical protein
MILRIDIHRWFAMVAIKKILSTSEVGSILALIAPSPFFQIGGFLYFGGHFGWPP